MIAPPSITTMAAGAATAFGGPVFEVTDTTTGARSRVYGAMTPEEAVEAVRRAQAYRDNALWLGAALGGIATFFLLVAIL